MLKEHLFIVFSKEHYNSLGVIRSLGKKGIESVYIAEKAKGPASRMSKYIKTVHVVDSKEEGFELLISHYGSLDKKPFLITTDDETQQMIDENYSLIKDKFVFFNAGAEGRITKYMDKEEILSIAQNHGLLIPETIVVERGVIPEGLNYPVITKSISPNVGGWKKDVHICYSEKELHDAFDSILSPKVLVQSFIDKKNECCLEGISINSGKDILIPMAIRYNYIIQGYYSPYMTAYPYTDEEMIEKVNSLIKDIGYEGLFDVEFLVDKDGKMYFTEINFRNSIWDYIGVFDDLPYPIIWAEGVLGGAFNDKWRRKLSKEYRAMVEPIDYSIRVKKGSTSLAEWLNDFKNADVLFYHDKDDIAPFVEMVNNWELYS